LATDITSSFLLLTSFWRAILAYLLLKRVTDVIAAMVTHEAERTEGG